MPCNVIKDFDQRDGERLSMQGSSKNDTPSLQGQDTH